MSSTIQITIRNSGGAGVAKVSPSFSSGTYFGLDPNYQTGDSEVQVGRSVVYGVYFKGSDVTGTYTDTLVFSNSTGEDIHYKLKVKVVNSVPDFYGDPAFGSTIDLGKILPVDVTTTIGSGSAQCALPLWINNYYFRDQIIYLQSDLGETGTIKSLALDVDQVPSSTISSLTIRMRHTSLSQYPSVGYVWESTDWTTVYSESSVSIASTGWFTFNFSTPFIYNGTDNLMIDFNISTSPTGMFGYVLGDSYLVGASRNLYANTNSYPDPLTWSGSVDPVPSRGINSPNIKIVKNEAMPSSTSEIVIINDTKLPIEILAPSLTTGTYFTIDVNFTTSEITLDPGDSATYGFYFNGSSIMNQTYTDIMTLKNGYGSDIVYNLSANTISVPLLSATPSNGSTIVFNSGQGDSESSTVTISNIGETGSSIVLTGASFSGADLALFSLVPSFVNPTSVMAPGSSSYAVKFSGPAGIGSYSAALTFTNGFTSDIVYTLQGNVVAFPDNFADAQTLTGNLPISVSDNNNGATYEVGEPFHMYISGVGYYVVAHSLWYKWVSTLTGNIRLAIISDEVYASASMYTGATVGTLSRVVGGSVASDYDANVTYYSLPTAVTLGTTYYIGVGNWDTYYGGFTLTIEEV